MKQSKPDTERLRESKRWQRWAGSRKRVRRLVGVRGEKTLLWKSLDSANRKSHCHSPICCSQSSTSCTKHFYDIGTTRDWYHWARLGALLLRVLLLKHIFATGWFSGSWATRLGHFVNFTWQNLVGFMKFPANKICQAKIIEIGKLASFTKQKGFEALNFPLRCVFFFFFQEEQENTDLNVMSDWSCLVLSFLFRDFLFCIEILLFSDR